MSDTKGIKIFEALNGSISFDYHAAGRFPLVVIIQDKRGPRQCSLDEEETEELYQWLRRMREPAPAEQKEA